MKKIIVYIVSLAILAGVTFACAACEDPEQTVPPPTNSEEFSADFYTAENWSYTTKENGSQTSVGGMPVSLSDGSIKFQNTSQAFCFDKDLSNETISFMIKASKNWQLWLRASSKDEDSADCYKLVFEEETLYLKTSESDISLAQVTATACDYTGGEWNKIKVVFSTDESNNCTVKVTVNRTVAPFVATPGGDGVVAARKVTYAEPEGFDTGKYVIAKVWSSHYTDSFMQLKPVANADVADVLKIACLGDSITYGACADNEYTESYPAQLQQLFGNTANVINFGRSGAILRTLEQSADSYRKTTVYQSALSFRANVAIIMLGTNDAFSSDVTEREILDAYAVLAEEMLESNPKMKIYIATSPCAYGLTYTTKLDSVIVPAQKAYAGQNSLPLIDINAYTENLSNCYADNVHLKTKGYTYLAYVMYCALNDVVPDQDYLNEFKDV